MVNFYALTHGLKGKSLPESQLILTHELKGKNQWVKGLKFMALTHGFKGKKLPF